ncbi:hypothetical protein L7F22_023435 [Adiantum nelumboides]|nr:hypothetical protein [Adiantum nelumboides]MCO5569720.1 hypothetical protein [Adiantum nelumboides]
MPNMESPPNPQGPQASLNSAPNPSLASQPKPSNGKSTKRKELSNEEVVLETQQPIPKKHRASKKEVMMDLGKDDDDNNKKRKQGVNLWEKVATKLARIYFDFDKDIESCHKKWQVVLVKYRVDKTHNSIFGNDKKHTCKWFDVVDEYYHDTATVTPLIHVSSSTMDDATFLGDEDIVPLDDEKPQAPMSLGHRATPKYEDSLATMADTGKQLLKPLKEIFIETISLERERLKILSGLHAMMAEYLKDDIIAACLVLHNICIQHGESFDMECVHEVEAELSVRSGRAEEGQRAVATFVRELQATREVDIEDAMERAQGGNKGGASDLGLGSER